MNIKDWQKEIHANARNKGFWDEPRNIGESLMLVVTEVVEAMEAHRSYDDIGFAEELADIVIRVMDLAGGLGIDLENEIASKHKFNKTRPYKHGKSC